MQKRATEKRGLTLKKVGNAELARESEGADGKKLKEGEGEHRSYIPQRKEESGTKKKKAGVESIFSLTEKTKEGERRSRKTII